MRRDDQGCGVLLGVVAQLEERSSCGAVVVGQQGESLLVDAAGRVRGVADEQDLSCGGAQEHGEMALGVPRRGDQPEGAVVEEVEGAANGPCAVPWRSTSTRVIRPGCGRWADT